MLAISGAGVLIGFIYPMLADGFGDPLAFINGIMVGLSASFVVAVFELFVFNQYRNKLSFWLIVLLKTLFYLALVVVLTVIIIGFNESLFFGRGFWEHINGPRFQKFIYQDDFGIIVLYALVSIGAIIFTWQINRKMGQGILFNFVIGKYHRPREEEQVLMFLDLKSSTTIAETIGAMRFYRLLNDFFFDISKCILMTDGKIYRYVGDQVVVTWNVRSGLKNANCVRTFFCIKNIVERMKEKYLNNYGLVPNFTASFHVGKVIRGEIGDVKSQIVIHGETLYVTALVEKQCGTLKEDILITSDLQREISLPVIYESQKVGSLNFDREIDLYSIRERTLPE